MADIVLGIGTSHTPLLSLKPELWLTYAEADKRNRELSFPPHGWVMPFEKGVEYAADTAREKFKGEEPFAEQAAAFQRSLDTLASTLQKAAPDVTLIISDDQDEWFYEHNMPRFAVYWGESVPMWPRKPMPGGHPEIQAAISAGYGDIALEVPVAHEFGRHLVEYLSEHEFDVAHLNYLSQPYGGRVQRRYPTPDNGETDYVRETPPKEQGLPHGFSFIVKRLYDNQPRPILPVFQNTCYPPNQPSPKRSFQFGKAIADAVKAWQGADRVAVVASGGLSHFVVDEDLDRCLLKALAEKDAETLQTLPRDRLYSATSESLNWVALGGAMHDTNLKMELVDYVPVYRSPAATGGGWAFARWQGGS
jgi:hypothetical protein